MINEIQLAIWEISHRLMFAIVQPLVLKLKRLFLEFYRGTSKGRNLIKNGSSLDRAFTTSM